MLTARDAIADRVAGLETGADELDWRILDVLERNKVRATVDVNGLAVQKWPEAVKALHDAGNEIAGTACGRWSAAISRLAGM